jgi:cytochrome P450
MGKLDLLMLWAAQGNTAPASYWTLRSILLAKERGDKWVSDLLAEIDASFADGAYDPNVSTPVLDACITEALRMNTSIFVMRQAVDSSVPLGPDTQVTDGPPVPIPGTPYSLPLGARLIMPVRAGMHFDSNLYGEDTWPPGVFDPMRHVEAGPGMTGKRTMPFGAGYSMCPGRRFATNEIRCLVAVLLKRYGLVLTDTGSDDFVPGRAGFGVQWAKRTAQARISIKG